MNTNDALKRLVEIFRGFLLHKYFVEEIGKLLKKELKGKEESFFKLLVSQLNNIKLFGCMIHSVDGHEQLKGMDGHYYSIHLQQKQFNVRLLVYISDEGIPYFLSAFYERQGKNSSDYSKQIPVLEQRLCQMLGDDENE